MLKKRYNLTRKNRKYQPKDFLHHLAHKDPPSAMVYLRILQIMLESRREAGLTRAQLADMAGTTEQMIFDFEMGKIALSPALFDRLKQLLMVTIVSGDGSDVPPNPDGSPRAVYDLRESANYGEHSFENGTVFQYWAI